ncbi:hypothetical protein [Algimonas arctica]|uniref:hypothetical protein n=1 Tax=Algimonas arctica TaxID=1479486 RepID=UPI0016756732|nr:hypothetical protein [Algimonas arctica]
MSVTKIDELAKAVVDEAITASKSAEADIVLVLPPFASPDRPSLGLHILQNIAQAKGYKTTVLYANLSFARLIGPLLYRHLCHTPTEDLTGERLFRLAWLSVVHFGGGSAPERWSDLHPSTPIFQSLQEQAVVWSEAMARGIAGLDASVIGFSSTFEQTLSSLSIASRLKKYAPDKTTILGAQTQTMLWEKPSLTSHRRLIMFSKVRRSQPFSPSWRTEPRMSR